MTRSIEIGETFGRLTVLGKVPSGKNMRFHCRCACGNESYPQRGSLLSGSAQSCGCLRKERARAALTKHGGTRAQEFKIFSGMKGRCENRNSKSYPNYGGRGIQVRYKDFQEFLADLGPRPPGGCVERIDTNGHYEVGNCVWSTQAENNLNMRTCKVWIIEGKTYQSARLAAKALGLSTTTVINACNGYNRSGRTYPPREGWRCELKYQDAARRALAHLEATA